MKLLTSEMVTAGPSGAWHYLGLAGPQAGSQKTKTKSIQKVWHGLTLSTTFQEFKNVFGFFWNWDIVSCPCLTQSVLGWPSSRQHWHKLVDLVQLLTKPGELWISLSSPVDSPFGSTLKMFSNPVLVNCQLLTCISRLPTPATKVLHLVISLS